MHTVDDINIFLKKRLGRKVIKPDADIFEDFGCVGDDFHELMEAYAEAFQVDMADYLWYFHTDEEGWNFGGWFFAPPHDRVKHIPVTPLMLLSFANSGKWNIKYPSHKLPKRRYDLLINQALAALSFIAMGFLLYFKYTR